MTAIIHAVPDLPDYRAVLRAKTEAEAPAPWQARVIRIAGITAVGFAPGSDLLVVLSHNGVGVVDPFTPQVVARSQDDDTGGDHYPVAVQGIGPLAGTNVPVAGLWGGGLRRFTPDGWQLSVIAPDWPNEKVALSPPGSWGPIADPASAHIVADYGDSVRAAGFSDSGRVMVVAYTHLYLWTRVEVPARR
jgi:hypothetical protein